MTFPADEEAARYSSVAIRARRKGYPNSDLLTPQNRANIFDPALKQYGSAYRAGDPIFKDLGAQSRWQTAREAVMAHMLRVIGESPWQGNLMLHGSCLLKAWLGEVARPPKDIDWVVIPQSLASNSEEASDMMDGITDLLSQKPSAGLAMIDATRATRDAIWTYERADGMRITFPWIAPDLPQGTLQMDFIFGDALWTPPVLTSLPLDGGAPISLLAASPELSLAWKLQWLLTDEYPQGKDLHDAAILAERVVLPPHLIESLVKCLDPDGQTQMAGVRRVLDFLARTYMINNIDWKNFLLEYPWIQGSKSEWLQRLVAGLERSAGAGNQP